MANLQTSTTEQDNIVALSKSTGLSNKEILAKLDPIPVFTIADEQGAPLITTGEAEAKVAGVFISEQDANDFVKELKSTNPKLAKKVSVIPVSLGEIYQLSQSEGNQEDPLDFAYVPEADEVKAAKTVAKEDGEKYQGGVPLFVAKGGDKQGYLTFDRDGKQVIPFFFDKQQLDEFVAKFEEQDPDRATNIDIEVQPLEGVIETLETSNDKILSQIVLVPSSESIEFLESNDLETIDGNSNKNKKDNTVESLSKQTFEDTSYLGADTLSGSPEEDTGTNLYSILEAESRSMRDSLTNYTDEGTSFDAYSDQQEETISIYSFFDAESDTSFYTPSTAERDNVEDNLSNYESERIADYGFPVDAEV
jgi:hypothetical protein